MKNPRLLTNREAPTLAEAATLIDWYRCRWEIEMFFNILKNGCKVEALQLAAMPRIELALSFFMIVAWRIGYLMRLGRTCPDMDCEIVFDREEWQAAWLVAGVKSLWQGLQRVMDFAMGIQAAKEALSCV